MTTQVLTDDEIDTLMALGLPRTRPSKGFRDFARAVESRVIAALAERAGTMPKAWAHLYPENEEGVYLPCYTPSTQGADGRKHQPVYTANAMRAHAAAAFAAGMVAKMELAGEITGTEKRGFALMTVVRWESGFNRIASGTKLYALPQPPKESKE